MAGVRFWCAQEFLFWEDNKLIAHYVPGLSYFCDPSRPGHARLHTLLFGGVLETALPVYAEKSDSGEMVEYKNGDTVEGWINEGRFTLVGPAGETGGEGGQIGGTIETGGGD